MSKARREWWSHWALARPSATTGTSNDCARKAGTLRVLAHYTAERAKVGRPEQTPQVRSFHAPMLAALRVEAKVLNRPGRGAPVTRSLPCSLQIGQQSSSFDQGGYRLLLGGEDPELRRPIHAFVSGAQGAQSARRLRPIEKAEGPPRANPTMTPTFGDCDSASGPPIAAG